MSCAKERRPACLTPNLKLAIMHGLLDLTVQTACTSEGARFCALACARHHDDSQVMFAPLNSRASTRPLWMGRSPRAIDKRLFSMFLHQSEGDRYSLDSECLLAAPTVGERTLINGCPQIKSLYCVSTTVEAWTPLLQNSGEIWARTMNVTIVIYPLCKMG